MWNLVWIYVVSESAVPQCNELQKQAREGLAQNVCGLEALPGECVASGWVPLRRLCPTETFPLSTFTRRRQVLPSKHRSVVCVLFLRAPEKEPPRRLCPTETLPFSTAPRRCFSEANAAKRCP